MKFKKITAIITSVLMAGATVGFAAAANYPAPFVDNGVADVAIVYGTGAGGVSTFDMAAAVNVQKSFVDAMPSGGFTVGDESYLLKATGDELTFGEALSSVKTSLDEVELENLLARGNLIDDDVEYDEEEEIEYTQEIVLKTDAVTFGDLDKDDYMINTDLSDDELPVLHIDQSSGAAYSLTVDFATAINATAYDESESMTIFGKALTFDPNMDAGDTELVFFESTDTISIGYQETKTINGDTIEVTGGTATTVNLVINGNSYSVSEGETKEGYYVSKVISSTIGDGSVSVELFAGANEWKLTEGSEVEIDGVDLDGVVVSGISDLEDIDAITFAITPSAMDSDDDHGDEIQYLEIGESFVDPLFGSFALLFDSVEPTLDNSDKDKMEIAVKATADFKFTSRNENAYDISPFKLNDDDDGVDVHDDWFVNANYTGLEKDSIFIASEGTTKSEETLVYQVYKINDGDDTPSVEFKELSSGDTVKVYELKELGDTDLFVSDLADGDSSFDLESTTGGTVAAMNNELITEAGMSISLKREATITVTDVNATGFTLNGDAFTTTAEATTSTAATNLTADLVAAGYAATVSSAVITIAGFQVNTLATGVNATLAVATEFYFDEDADDVFSLDSEVTPTNITVTVGADTTDDELELTIVEGSDFTEVANSNTDMKYAVSELGTYYEADDDENAYLNVWTPIEGQTVYNVIVASTDSVTPNGNPLGDILVKDIEIATVSNNNLIIVGGSCINSAAAEVLGGAYCGAAFTEATGVGTGQFMIKGVMDKFSTGKLALVVAGYTLTDTTNAVKYLTMKEGIDTSGDLIGTTAMAEELIVN